VCVCVTVVTVTVVGVCGCGVMRVCGVEVGEGVGVEVDWNLWIVDVAEKVCTAHRHTHHPSFPCIAPINPKDCHGERCGRVPSVRLYRTQRNYQTQVQDLAFLRFYIPNIYPPSVYHVLSSAASKQSFIATH
jgi:hypothetical protein